MRYHQVGTPTGWLEIDGERHEITPEEWSCTRDHSWGVRYGVGIDPIDIQPGIDTTDLPMHFLWCPMRFEKANGEQYSVHHFYLDINIPEYDYTFHGGIEHTDGSRTAFKDMRPDLKYNQTNRRLEGGTLNFIEEDGTERPMTVEVLSDTGFHLGAGLYFGFKGFHHGSWRGELHVEGEYIEDCSVIEQAKELHQLRDTVVRVTDGDTVGWGNFQTTVLGEWPSLNLDMSSNFV